MPDAPRIHNWSQVTEAYPEFYDVAAMLDKRLTPAQRSQIRAYSASLESRTRQDFADFTAKGGGNVLDEWAIWNNQTDGFLLTMFHFAFYHAQQHEATGSLPEQQYVWYFLPWVVWADADTLDLFNASSPFYMGGMEALYQAVLTQGQQTTTQQTAGTGSYIMADNFLSFIQQNSSITPQGNTLWAGMSLDQQKAFQAIETDWWNTNGGVYQSPPDLMPNWLAWKALPPGVRFTIYGLAAKNAQYEKLLPDIFTTFADKANFMTPFLKRFNTLYTEVAPVGSVQTSGTAASSGGSSGGGILLGIGALLLALLGGKKK